MANVIDLDRRPRIRYLPAEHHSMVDRAIDALAANPDLYVMGGRLCMFIEATEERPSALIRLNRDTMPSALSSSAVFYTITGNGEKDLAPPAPIVKDLASRGAWPGIREVSRISRVPPIRPDGSCVTEPGYDAESGMIFDPLGSDWSMPAIPEAPTQDDARAAVERLRAHFGTFPWRTDLDFTGLLGLMLSISCWNLYDGNAPAFVTEANMRGCGKSMVTGAAIEIATGVSEVSGAWPGEEPEKRKRLESAVISQFPAFMFDNTDSSIGGAALDGVLTSRVYTFRNLGTQSSSTARMNTVWCFTVNGRSYSKDTARRVIPIRLLCKVHNPEDRKADPVPFRVLTSSKRGALYADLVTIARAFVQAGSPQPEDAVTLGSFEGWASFVRSALLYAGAGDVLASRAGLEEFDEDTVALAQLVEALWEAYGSTDWTAAQVLTKARSEPDLRNAMDDAFGDKLNSRQLGIRLNKWNERPSESGLQIEKVKRTSKKKGANRYRIIDTNADTKAATDRRYPPEEGWMPNGAGGHLRLVETDAVP